MNTCGIWLYKCFNDGQKKKAESNLKPDDSNDNHAFSIHTLMYCHVYDNDV